MFRFKKKLSELDLKKLAKKYCADELLRIKTALRSFKQARKIAQARDIKKYKKLEERETLIKETKNTIFVEKLKEIFGLKN